MLSQQKTVMRAGTAREVNAKVPAKQALMTTLLQRTAGVLTIAMLLWGADVRAQVSESQPAAPCDASEVRPPVTKADLEIAKLAKQILDSPAKWNRADNRKCPAEAKTFSLYCALEKATDEVSGKFEHRGAAMQEARFVIDAVAPNRKNYNHRLMDYNNDPATTFADIQKVFGLLEDRIAARLNEDPSKVQAAGHSAADCGPAPAAPTPVTKADLQIVKRVREILDSPSKWNRASTQTCPEDAQTFGLFCAFEKAAKEVNGNFDGAATEETRIVISETAPNRDKYRGRLVDYNNDPAITFADLQKLLQLVEERLTKRLAHESPDVK
jgi:hypothetical protein